VLADFLQEFSSGYVSARKRDYDTQQSKLLTWHLNEMAADFELYRELLETGSSITENIESLLAVLAITDGEAEHSKQLSVLGGELRACCRDVQAQLTKLSEDLKHRLKLLELRRNMSQSDHVERLTLLATVFLPMSLAAGILSMKSRFKDLGDVLYDFFGVVILLGYGAILLFTVMVVLGFVKEANSRLVWHGGFSRQVRRGLPWVWVAAASSFAALVLVSFVVGMFKDVTLGASILFEGTYIAVIGSIFLGLTWLKPALNIVLKGTLVLYRRKRANKRATDLEGDSSATANRSEPTRQTQQ
jgi:hypothetical protein